MNMKKCSKCGTEWPTTFFHRNSRSADGRQNYCIGCAATYGRERARNYAEDPAHVKKKRAEHARRFYYNNHERIKEEKAIAAHIKRHDGNFDVVGFLLDRINAVLCDGSDKYADRVCQLLGVGSAQEAREHFDNMAADKGLDRYRIDTAVLVSMNTVSEDQKLKTFNIKRLGVTPWKQ